MEVMIAPSFGGDSEGSLLFSVHLKFRCLILESWCVYLQVEKRRAEEISNIQGKTCQYTILM